MADEKPPAYSAYPNLAGQGEPQPYPPPEMQPYPPQPMPTMAGQPQMMAPPPGVAMQTQAVFVAPAAFLGYDPAQTTCPRCQASVVTEVRYENGLLVWLIFGIMFLLGFFLLVPWCLCFIPFCVDGCKDVTHVCPNCHQLIGRRNRI